LLQEERQQKPLEVIELLDGKLRVAEPKGDAWQVNEWVKKAVVMYFYPENGET
jgi:2,3,4,5-tetrahydropyridine-2-carboxylate N-succinyltransferase